MSRIRTAKQIESLRIAGKIWYEVKQVLLSQIKPDVTTEEMDELAIRTIKSRGGLGVFKGYFSYPKNICISVNDEIIHGIPSQKKLKKGDFVKFDIGVMYDEMIVDAAFSCTVGESVSAHRGIAQAGEMALSSAEAILKDGVTTTDIASVIEKTIRQQGYLPLQDFSGHGCGKQLHEEPQIPNYVDKQAYDDAVLETGMTVCLEPMLIAGKPGYVIDPDGWTVRTVDKSLGGHVERMYLIKNDGYEVIAG